MEYIELRKGNLIYFPFIKENVEVIGINALWGNPYFNKLSVKNGLDMYYESIDIFKPIPLTEECLLKLGNAEIKPFAKGIIVFERFIFQWKESYKYWYVMEIHSLSYLTKIEFVHEYQNFIFALTGKELTIK